MVSSFLVLYLTDDKTDYRFLYTHCFLHFSEKIFPSIKNGFRRGTIVFSVVPLQNPLSGKPVLVPAFTSLY